MSEQDFVGVIGETVDRLIETDVLDAQDVEYWDMRGYALKNILTAHRLEVVKKLESIRPKAYPDPKGGEAEWNMWADHYMNELDELIAKYKEQE